MADPKCSNGQYLDTEGFCKDCPPFKKPSDTVKGTCVSDSCSDRQILTKAGSCSDCNDYERPQGVIRVEFGDVEGNGQTCGPNKCRSREKLLTNGLCEACAGNQYVSEDGK